MTSETIQSILQAKVNKSLFFQIHDTEEGWRLFVDGKEFVEASRVEKIIISEVELITLDEMEKRMIERTMVHFDNNVAKTARSLGVGQATIYRKLQRYGIESPQKKKSRLKYERGQAPLHRPKPERSYQSLDPTDECGITGIRSAT
jgi:hypothetical protein